ncbi:MAG: molybdopterin molybdenumtransferase MoeA, partial [Lysobacteraceae bacterium]
MNAPRPPLKSLDDALAELLAFAAPLEGAETVSTFDADGRVLAEDVVSPLQVPPADNSAMDGYAVRVADIPAAGTALPVSQRIAAGSQGEPLAPGSVARIFTGAPVPPGADAVVMQEDVEVFTQDGVAMVRIHSVPPVGLSIRRSGE